MVHVMSWFYVMAMVQIRGIDSESLDEFRIVNKSAEIFSTKLLSAGIDSIFFSSGCLVRQAVLWWLK